MPTPQIKDEKTYQALRREGNPMRRSRTGSCSPSPGRPATLRRPAASGTGRSTTSTRPTAPAARCPASTSRSPKPKAVAGKAPVKRNRFIKLTGAGKSVNRELEAKARSIAGIKGYITNLGACPDGTPVTAEFIISACHHPGGGACMIPAPFDYIAAESAEHAATPHVVLASSDVVRAQAPLLAQSATQVGDPQIRHRGTIGGSLTHTDPAADLPMALLALGGSVDVLGARTVPAPSRPGTSSPGFSRPAWSPVS